MALLFKNFNAEEMLEIHRPVKVNISNTIVTTGLETREEDHQEDSVEEERVPLTGGGILLESELRDVQTSEIEPPTPANTPVPIPTPKTQMVSYLTRTNSGYRPLFVQLPEMLIVDKDQNSIVFEGDENVYNLRDQIRNKLSKDIHVRSREFFNGKSFTIEKIQEAFGNVSTGDIKLNIDWDKVRIQDQFGIQRGKDDDTYQVATPVVKFESVSYLSGGKIRLNCLVTQMRVFSVNLDNETFMVQDEVKDEYKTENDPKDAKDEYSWW